MKITIDVTGKELTEFERYTMCINSCRKHNAIDISEEEYYLLHRNTCKNCIKKELKLNKTCTNLMFKLWEAYEKKI